MDHGFDFSKTVVLVADDIRMMQVMHEKHLLRLGFTRENIIIAADGLIALTELEELVKAGRKPTIIICDWNMPKLNGIDFLKKVHADPATKDVLLIMVTGHEKKEDYPKLKAIGLNGLMFKPFSVAEYDKKLLEVLSIKFKKD